jgi:hypothetical protein
MDGFPLVLVLVGGAAAALLVIGFMRRAQAARDAVEYKPIVIDRSEARERRDSRIPVTPISINKSPTPVPRAKEPTGAPLRSKLPTAPPALRPSELAARTTPPSDPAIQIPSRTRTSSSPPIDVALRLGGALDVAIRPPLPEPVPVPADQIPVAPGSGLTIRKRTQSAGPIAADSLPPEVFAVRTRTPTGATMPSVAAALANPAQVKLRGHLRYALTTAAFSSAGITANREDGFAKLVKWPDVVGIVARRLPDVAPYDGAAFVDVVSTAGATLRLLPWTDISGHELGGNAAGDGIERLRSLVQMLAALCHEAKVDPATRAFQQGTGKPAQLPDEKTLAAHDAKLR